MIVMTQIHFRTKILVQDSADHPFILVSQTHKHINMEIRVLIAHQYSDSI